MSLLALNDLLRCKFTDVKLEEPLKNWPCPPNGLNEYPSLASNRLMGYWT